MGTQLKKRREQAKTTDFYKQVASFKRRAQEAAFFIATTAGDRPYRQIIAQLEKILHNPYDTTLEEVRALGVLLDESERETLLTSYGSLCQPNLEGGVTF